MNDPESILQRLAETTMQVTGAHSAGVSILEHGPEGGVFRWYAIAGEYAGNIDQTMTWHESPCGLVMSNQRTMLFIRPARHYTEIHGAEPEIVENLLAPFYCSGEPVGTIWALSHNEEKQFDSEDVRLLSSLTRFASAGYQLLNAHAGEVRSRRASEEHFRALVNTTSDAVYRMSPDWSEMYELHGGQFLKDTTQGNPNWLEEYIHPHDQPRVLQTIHRSIEQKCPFELEHRVRQQDGNLGWVLSRAVPVTGQNGEINCWFGAGSDITARKQAEEALRQSESQLSARVDVATAELRALSQQLLSVQETERRNLAHELHDEIGQSLTGLAFSLEMASRDEGAPHLEQAQQIARGLLDQVRALTLELRPSMLDDIGLVPALLALAESFPDRTGVQVDLYHEGTEERFETEIETAAYRIVQEALTNVARHSGIDRATVRVVSGERLTIWISDCGRGFDPDAVRTAGLYSGLAGMRERATLIGGELQIDSSPGEGTTIILNLPDSQTQRPRSTGEQS